MPRRSIYIRPNGILGYKWEILFFLQHMFVNWKQLFLCHIYQVSFYLNEQRSSNALHECLQCATYLSYIF